MKLSSWTVVISTNDAPIYAPHVTEYAARLKMVRHRAYRADLQNERLLSPT